VTIFCHPLSDKGNFSLVVVADREISERKFDRKLMIMQMLWCFFRRAIGGLEFDS
jgi:hypothetical protein